MVSHLPKDGKLLSRSLGRVDVTEHGMAKGDVSVFDRRAVSLPSPLVPFSTYDAIGPVCDVLRRGVPRPDMFRQVNVPLLSKSHPDMDALARELYAFFGKFEICVKSDSCFARTEVDQVTKVYIMVQK